MRQGEIWFADLDPAKGSEQSGRRPVVVISGNTLNDALPIVIVVPVTSKIKSYPACTMLKTGRTSGLKKESEAISFQVRALAKKRLIKRIGRVTGEELREILRGLFVVLTH
ncbi:MAG: type II toxin-antitoxin system PemK/MazF family toxin [bacterium]|nr:type II toxin-antitoxin system PemK/MazF family toxin [bacterium]